MAQQVIYTGTVPNDRTGDALRAACVKVNANFAEVYAALQAYLETFGGYTPASFQAASNDLALIVGQGTTMFGRGLLNLSNAAALQGLLSLGTAAGYDVGTAPGNVVRTDPTTGKLPALDGSQLTNIVALSNAVPKATTGQAQAGQDSSAYMTAATTAAAIQALQVIIALATTEQAQAGTNDTAYMTPLKTAQEIAALRAFATTVQAQAGTAEDVVMTPARTKEAIASLTKVNSAFARIAALYQNTASAFTDVPGLSITITPVSATSTIQIDLGLILSASGSSANAQWRLTRGDGTSVLASGETGVVSDTTPRGFPIKVQDVPGSGPQTYKIQMMRAGTGFAFAYANTSISAKDLGS